MTDTPTPEPEAPMIVCFLPPPPGSTRCTCGAATSCDECVDEPGCRCCYCEGVAE